MPKINNLRFDVELIIVHKNMIAPITNEPYKIATYRIFRGLTIEQVDMLVKSNQGANPECIEIKFNIRGAN